MEEYTIGSPLPVAMRFKVFIALLLLIIGGFLFYWFQIRPYLFQKDTQIADLKKDNELLRNDLKTFMQTMESRQKMKPINDENSSALNDIRSMLEDQQWENEEFINCQRNNGIYQGNGVCQLR